MIFDSFDRKWYFLSVWNHAYDHQILLLATKDDRFAKKKTTYNLTIDSQKPLATPLPTPPQPTKGIGGYGGWQVDVQLHSTSFGWIYSILEALPKTNCLAGFRTCLMLNAMPDSRLQITLFCWEILHLALMRILVTPACP